MKTQAQEHLDQLDLDWGSSIDDVRQAFRRLSFIWHPDRHPEAYQELAEQKMCKLNDAFQFFNSEPARLSPPEPEWISEPSSDLPREKRIAVVTCARCQGKGKVVEAVDGLGRFQQTSCRPCGGKGEVVVDLDHACQNCGGTGMNEVSDQEREAWMDVEMRKRGLFERNFNPALAKHLWHRHFLEKELCSDCGGVGYAFHHRERRKTHRRKASAADFLQELQGEERRSQENDRRKRA